jgi:hypothetical protein
MIRGGGVVVLWSFADDAAFPRLRASFRCFLLSLLLHSRIFINDYMKIHVVFPGLAARTVVPFPLPLVEYSY